MKNNNNTETQFTDTELKYNPMVMAREALKLARKLADGYYDVCSIGTKLGTYSEVKHLIALVAEIRQGLPEGQIELITWKAEEYLWEWSKTLA
jgi:hypothetical protein